MLFGGRAGCLLERTSMLVHVLPTEPGPAILATLQKRGLFATLELGMECDWGHLGTVN